MSDIGPETPPSGRDKSYMALAKLAVGMISRTSSQVSALAMTFVAVYFLSPTDFGVFALSSSTVAIVRTLLYGATFQYILKTANLEKYATECLIVSGIIAAIVSAIFLAILGSFDIFGSPEIYWIVLFLTPSNLISVFAAWIEAQILRQGRLNSYYAATAGTELTAVVISVVLFVLGWGVWALVAQIYLRNSIVIIFYLMIGRPVYSTSISLRRAFEVLLWSLPQYGSMAAGLASNYGADFIVGAFLSTGAAGLFRAASRITAAVSDICSQPLRIMGMTLFSARAAAGLDARRAYSDVLGMSFILPATALAGLAVVSPWAVPLLLGDQWAGTAPIIPILCAARFLGALATISSPMLVAYGRHVILLPIQLASTTIMLAGLFWTASSGLISVATVTAVANAIAALGIIWVAVTINKRQLADSSGPFLVGLVCAAIPAAITYSVLLLGAGSSLSPIGLLAVAIVLGILSWLLTLLAFRKPVMRVVKGLSDLPRNGPVDRDNQHSAAD